MGTLALLVVVAALAGVAVGSTPPAPPAPSTDPGYTILAELPVVVAQCILDGKCKSKILYCPLQCKNRDNLLAGLKACFIDCIKCEATCKHRKPNCQGYGSICYDPRLVGGDGSMFYFHGEKDQNFCLVSDRNVHINGHFIGLRPNGRSRDYTWVQALGFLFGTHKFSVGAKKVAYWDDNVDQLLFSFDGVPFALAEKAGDVWVSEDGQIKVERTYQRNVVEVVLNDIVTVLIQVVPITAKEDKAHNYQLPRDDVFAHLDLQFKFYKLSANVNGALGQTYQPGYTSAAKVGVMMPVLGGEDRFFASGLLESDCKASQFSPESSSTTTEEIIMPVTTDWSSKNTASGIVTRR